MNQYNKYGFISGGALFDMMDRFALRTLNTQHPETDKEFWFTQNSETFFLKQACTDTDVRPRLRYLNKQNDIAYIGTEILNVDTGITIASATFVFKKKNHNFCETKGGTHENNNGSGF